MAIAPLFPEHSGEQNGFILVESYKNVIRAVVIEDCPMFRERLILLLNETGKVVVTGTAASLFDAIRVIDQERPELVLLDTLFERGTGVQLLEHFRSTRRRMRIAVITNAPSPELEKCCFALGAEWFVDKADGFDRINGICEEVSRRSFQAA